MMKQLTMILKGSWMKVALKTESLKRKYHSISISKVFTWNKESLKVIRRHGGEARILRITEFTFEEKFRKMFSECVNAMPKLERIVLTHFLSKNCVPQSKEIKSLVLPRLKIVVMDRSWLGVSKFRKCEN
jgi:hypothetical protein